MNLSGEFNFERQTDRQSDRVHSISINPPLLPLNLSIDEPSLQQQGGCGGGGAPPTERPRTWVIAERSLFYFLNSLIHSLLQRLVILILTSSSSSPTDPFHSAFCCCCRFPHWTSFVESECCISIQVEQLSISTTSASLPAIC
jgi:hypothetical protein